MKKHSAFSASYDTKYILTRPTPLSSLNLDDFDGDTDLGWREKSRQLQARRWRKLRHQLV